MRENLKSFDRSWYELYLLEYFKLGSLLQAYIAGELKTNHAEMTF